MNGTEKLNLLINYLVDGPEVGEDLDTEFLLEKIDKGIAKRTREALCEWAGPEEDGSIAILKAMSLYVKDEYDFKEFLKEEV